MNAARPRGDGRRLAFPVLPVLFGVIAPLTLFAFLAVRVWRHGTFSWDASWPDAWRAGRAPALDTVLLWVTVAGNGWTLTPPVVAGSLLLWRAGLRRHAAYLTLTGAGAAALNLLLKVAFGRVRPVELPESLVRETWFSFPSGHAMGSFAVAFAFAAVAWPTRWRAWVLASGLGFALAVGFSRVYFGVHFPSDVIAGYAVSLVWATGTTLAFRAWRRP